MSFPHITCISDLQPHLASNPEIVTKDLPNGTKVVCYTISDETTFHGEHAAFKREARGITFNPDGSIAVRPLHKFFNVGECAETQLDALDLSEANIARLMLKRDGSMLSPMMVDGKIALKSKKTYESDVARMATAFMYEQLDKVIQHAKDIPLTYAMCRQMMNKNITPVFEFTSPKARIVINYQEPALTLLHLRDNVTGEYIMDHYQLKSYSKMFNVPLVEEFPASEITNILRRIATEEGIEGYVIQFKDGNMVKLKTPWYLQLHRTVTFTRRRDVAEMVLDETLDDYKSYLSAAGSLDTFKTVEEIEHAVVSHINMISAEVENIFVEDGHLDRKSIALKYSGHKYFGLIMARAIGKEPDYIGFYRKNILKNEFDLEQV